MKRLHLPVESLRSRTPEDATLIDESKEPLLCEDYLQDLSLSEDEDKSEVTVKRMKQEDWKCRYGILLFDCLLVFGTYFCIDMPSALQNEIQSDLDYKCGSNMTFKESELPCCDACLGLGPHKYNLLHAFLFWTSSFMSLFSGFAIDRLGNKVSAVLIIILTSTGTWLFALGGSTSMRGTDSMFPLMVVGRILIGFGDGPIRIVQDRIIAFWFREDSVMAVSLVVLSRRAGTMLNFLITANLAKTLNFDWSLMFGAILCTLGIPGALAMGCLDHFGTKQLDKESQKEMLNKPIKFSEIKNLTRTFWLHISMIGAHYCAFFAFVANGSNYIQIRYGYSLVHASYINGATYLSSVFLSPFLGVLLKKINCNGIVATVATAFSIPLFPLFAYVPSIPPLVVTIGIGIVYNFNVIILWQVAIELLPHNAFGTASGIALFVMRLGIGLSNLAAGNILEDKNQPDENVRLQRYTIVWLMFMVFSIISVIFGIILNIIDVTHGAKINKRLAKKTEEKLPLVNNSSHIQSNGHKSMETQQ